MAVQNQRGSYLVESQHLSSHLAAINQGDSHPVVNLKDASVFELDGVAEWCCARKSIESRRRCTYVAGLENRIVSAC